MARTRRSKKEVLQAKIEAAQAKLAELAEQSAAVQAEIDQYPADLSDLDAAEREAAEQATAKDLMKAIKKSGRSYDEVMAFLDSAEE